MTLKPPFGAVSLLLVFLWGCAAGTQAGAVSSQAEPDCSFRSATTCWTLSGRFPPRQAEPAEREPDLLRGEPPVLASAADTVETIR